MKPSHPHIAISASQAALSRLDPRDLSAALRRHVGRDWGEVDADLWSDNDAAVVSRRSVFSTYTTPSGTRVHVATGLGHHTVCVRLENR
jgi:hypothetical protein